MNYSFNKSVTIITLLFCALTTSLIAQVGINTTSPGNGAILDITSTDKGMLVPRVDIPDLGEIAPITGGSTQSLLVYNIGSTTSAGFYYWNVSSTEWIALAGSSGGDDWKITGNAGTSAATNFIGTTDNVDFMFRRNNIESGQIGATNTSLGVNTLLNNTGTNNTALGTDALKSNTSGIENTSLGTDALKSNTIGKWNSAVGYMALSLNIDDSDNTAMGAFALSKNTTGGLDNSAFGAHALENNTIGLGNAAFGEHALYNNIGGSSNTAVGENSLEENTSGIGNTVIGEDAGTRNTTGHGNVVIGQEALFSNPLGVSTGDNNVIIGRYAAQSNTSGHSNVIIGKDGLQANTAGFSNIAIGVAAGTDIDARSDAVAITTGDYNVLIGYKAEVGGSNANNATAIGFRAFADCDNCIVLGSNSGVNGAGGTRDANVGIGVNDPQYRLDVDGDINLTGDYRKNGTVIPDYVFETYFDNNNSFNPAYQFQSLSSIEKFIKINNHLPNMQNREDIAKNGWNVTENVRVNLEKIEELYLHVIDLNKEVKELSTENETLENLVKSQAEQLKVQTEKIDLILQKLEKN